MRGIVVARFFPGLIGLEADMRANAPSPTGGLSFSQRGDVICKQVLGHDRSAMLAAPPQQDASESEALECYQAERALEHWFISDSLDSNEFINQFMTWGFDLTDGTGARLESYVHFYQVMEGLARNALVAPDTEFLKPWRRARYQGHRESLERYRWSI